MRITHLLLLAAPLVAGAQTPSARTTADIDALAAAEYARDSIGSLTIGVVTAQGLAWTKSYGFADMSTRRLANRQSVYRIGSITKTFTALMLQQLMGDGRIKLSDPIERYYPEVREVQGYAKTPAPITVLQVATMTAGLAREPREEGPFWTGPASRWDSTLHSALPHTGIELPPGTKFQYSNIGYAILGATLGRAAGVPYMTWEKERIFTPLGMTHTAFEIEPAIANDLTQGYDIEPSGRFNGRQAAIDHRDGRGFKVPNGAIYTTVDDLSRFVVVQLGKGPPSVASPARIDSVYRSFLTLDGKPSANYGLGFSIEQRGDATWFGHDGGVAGYSAVMLYDRDRQVGVIVLRNAIGGRTNIGQLAQKSLTRASAQ